MPNTYSIAHPVAAIAERMIESYHPRLREVVEGNATGNGKRANAKAARA